ncbi:hypothetical protein QMTAC487_13760 [Sphaerotilus sp. FB-3]|nr:hypothetical protein QMTAC487_13760 [Sphaerotilus sp. FB-3]
MLLCGSRPRRCRQTGRIGLLWLGLVLLSQPAGAQSIDTRRSQATIGEPVEMSLQVRAFDIPPALLGPDCIAVRLQHADSGEAIEPIRIRTVPSGQDEQVTVQIQSPAIVEEPVLIGRVDLLCGAAFSREFTVLADPPRRPLSRRPAAQVRPTGQAHAAPATPAAASRLQSPSSPARADEAALTGAAELIARLVAERLPPSAPGVQAQAEPSEAWRHLHEQQRETRAALDELKLQLARQDSPAPPWRDAALVAGTLIGLGSCMMIGRLLHDRPTGSGLAGRRRTPSSTKRQRGQSAQEDEATSVGSPAPHAGQIRTHHAGTDAHTSSASPQGARIITIEWPQPQDDEASTAAAPTSSSASALPSAEDRSCWQDSNFGHPRLDDEGSQELLAELDAAPPGNAEQQLGWVMVLERRLLEGQGRCPWLLMRLLALYEQLRQPWNHERVAAQLEALYNVRVPPMSPPTTSASAASSQDGPRQLEQHELTWKQVCEHWNEAQAEAHLAALLLRPTALEELDLPAFEQLLTLHGLLRRREQMPRTSLLDVVEFDVLAA